MDKDNILWIALIVLIFTLFLGATGFGMIVYGPLYMGFGPIFMILILGLLAWIVVKLLRPWIASVDAEGKDHIAILKKRYASGEINRKEYVAMKRELERR